jgi:hypothetical protein
MYAIRTTQERLDYGPKKASELHTSKMGLGRTVQSKVTVDHWAMLATRGTGAGLTSVPAG